MASEAQRLIGISLTKIAQSRTHRGGVSLHKNLLVATVLQKARYIFMEEAYNMVHYQVPAAAVPSQHQHHHRQLSPDNNAPEDGEDLVGLTAEEGTTGGSVEPVSSALPGDDVEDVVPDYQQEQQSGCVKCTENQQQQQQSQDKENQPPYQPGAGELTYLDLDKNSPSVLRERSNCLKRRRAVTEWETEEAVQSILPKRLCSDDSTDDDSSSADSCGDDSVFAEDVTTATVLSETVAKEISNNNNNNSSEVETSSVTSNNNNNAMEIDRITSLVSIFSFGMASASASASSSSTSSADAGKLSRSLSTPDLCSAQAKDSTESLQHQQRPFLTMTV